MSNKVLNIELKRNNNKAMSTWEIQEFIGKLISNYYKIDLINEVAKAVNKGISLDRIFVLDRSFDYKINYSYLANENVIDLKEEQGAKNFYHLGSPVGLFPSRKLLEMNIQMEMLRKINNYLYAKQVKRLDKNKVNIILALNLNEAIEFMKKSAFTIIRKNFNVEEDVRVYCKDIDRIFNKELNRIEIFDLNETDVNNLKNKIILNKNYEMNVNEKGLYSQFFLEFNKSLLKLDRPIVGILGEDNRQVYILCKSYIHKKTRDSRFLDLKKFTHNSPTFVEICSGAAMAIPLIPMINGIRKSYENSISDRQLNEQESNIIDRLDNIIKELDDVESEANLDSVQKIDSNIINGGFSTLSEDVIKKINTNLSEYDFDNQNINIKVVDFTSEKSKRIKRKR